MAQAFGRGPNQPLSSARNSPTHRTAADPIIDRHQVRAHHWEPAFVLWTPRSSELLFPFSKLSVIFTCLTRRPAAVDHLLGATLISSPLHNASRTLVYYISWNLPSCGHERPHLVPCITYGFSHAILDFVCESTRSIVETAWTVTPRARRHRPEGFGDRTEASTSCAERR